MTTAGEKAMALVDGQLAPAEVPGLLDELARNAPLVVELQTYLAVSQHRLAAAYAAKAAEPVPAWLIAAVERAPVGARRAPAVSAFIEALREWLRTSYRVPAWSLAAVPAVAVLLAVVGSGFIGKAPGSGLAATDLAAALERTQSGKDTTLTALRPVLSFRSKTGDWCRQYEMRNAARQVSYGLACRSESGAWEVVASTPPASTGYTPAGADRRKMIDDIATSMMEHDPLSPADETATIAKGWRRL